MVSIWRVSDPALNSVANHTATTKIWHINPQFIIEPLLHEMIIQALESDSRLHKAVCVLFIHFKDFVHMSSHVQSNRSRNTRCSTPIANITPNTERPDRHLELVAKAHEGLHVLDIAW